MMKSISNTFKGLSLGGLVFALIFAVMSPSVFAVDQKLLKELTDKPLPAIEEPEINIKKLDNGARIYYLQDTELPVFKIKSFFEMGTNNESRDQRGITGFFMSVWAAGGSEKMPPNKMDEELEFLAAKISKSTGADLSSMKMVCLQKDMNQVLDIYFDLIKSPGFDPNRIEVIRKSMLDGIKRRNEEPMAVANREFLQSLFGKDSVYAWMSTPETINAITRDTLIKFYNSNVAPSRMWIAASSPLEFDEFLKVIEKYFTGWNTVLLKNKKPAPVKKEWEASTELIHKKGSQSSVVLGHFGAKRFNKDKFKLILADEILGGSTFGARLGDRIRTELGLAYSIQSNFGFSEDFAPFRIATQTKSESTVQTIREVKQILSDVVKNKSITEKELALAKERIINRLVFEYDIPFNIVAMRLTYDYHGYPPHYLKIYQKEIQAVTLDDMNGVLDQYFFPDKLKIMVVGDRDKIKGLEEFGNFKEIPLDDE